MHPHTNSSRLLKFTFDTVLIVTGKNVWIRLERVPSSNLMINKGRGGNQQYKSTANDTNTKPNMTGETLFIREDHKYIWRLVKCRRLLGGCMLMEGSGGFVGDVTK